MEESTQEEVTDQTEVDNTQESQDLVNQPGRRRRSSTLVTTEECSHAKQMKGELLKLTLSCLVACQKWVHFILPFDLELTPNGTCKEVTMDLGEAAVALESEDGEEEPRVMDDNVPTLADGKNE